MNIKTLKVLFLMRISINVFIEMSQVLQNLLQVTDQSIMVINHIQGVTKAEVKKTYLNI
jgi:hypothetical protein